MNYSDIMLIGRLWGIRPRSGKAVAGGVEGGRQSQRAIADAEHLRPVVGAVAGRCIPCIPRIPSALTCPDMGYIWDTWPGSHEPAWARSAYGRAA
jgi:hypothetical protein